MNIDKAVFVFAGLVIIAGMALGTFVNPWWYLLPTFVGLNLFQAGLTGFCPAAMIFRALGLVSGPAFGKVDCCKK
jgi:hypothetical protein